MSLSDIQCFCDFIIGNIKPDRKEIWGLQDIIYKNKDIFKIKECGFECF